MRRRAGRRRIAAMLLTDIVSSTTTVEELGEDWSFVLGSPVVEVLRHRPGLRPNDVVRSHAFGWTGPTIHEVTSEPRYLRILRMDPTLSPVELVREWARGAELFTAHSVVGGRSPAPDPFGEGSGSWSDPVLGHPQFSLRPLVCHPLRRAPRNALRGNPWRQSVTR